MAYERSPFGDGSATGSGNVTKAVHNHYGPFPGGKTVGNIKTEGALNELTIDLDGAMANAKAFPLDAPILPKLAKVVSAYVEVEEVFAASGTTPVLNIGTEGSEATNGIDVTKAQLEATGVYDVTATLAGTWTGGLAADTVVGLDLSGAGAATTNAGKARVVIRYLKV